MDYIPFTRYYAEKTLFEFLNLYKEFRIEKFDINENELVVCIEDSVLFYIRFNVECDFIIGEEYQERYREEGVCGLDIEELTYNSILPKYKHRPFLSRVDKKYGICSHWVRYAKFAGVGCHYLPNNMISHIEYVNSVLPEVSLQERNDAWQGFGYRIVVFEMEDIYGNMHYAVHAIKDKVHPFVLKVADALASKSFGECKISGIGITLTYFPDDFIGAIQSHKNVRRIKRLEEHLKYFSFEIQYFKNELDVDRAVREVADKLKNGFYQEVERTPYSKPEYKWKTEEFILKTVSKKYKSYGVISQHRPFFLRSSYGGQMSYDVFISGLNIAIEYQGKQHFEPIDFFGGQEAFEKVKIRDEEKLELSKAHGIKLVYINYWEDVTAELVISKIQTCLNS